MYCFVQKGQDRFRIWRDLGFAFENKATANKFTISPFWERIPFVHAGGLAIVIILFVDRVEGIYMYGSGFEK